MSECPDCSCSQYENCHVILNLMLDNEATKEQEEFFLSHIEKCIVCFSHYNVEKQIRELIKTKVSRQQVPDVLAEQIRSKIIS